MKSHLLALLLAVGAAGCTAPDADPRHAAVTAYTKQHANDPASYESARWGKPLPFTRRDSVKAILAPILARPGYAASQGGFVDKMIASPAFTDTARVGTLLTHAYRAKNKLGATVLDSAQFVVYAGGQVQQL